MDHDITYHGPAAPAPTLELLRKLLERWEGNPVTERSAEAFLEALPRYGFTLVARGAAPAPLCPKCGGWAAYDEPTGTCASCGFVRTELKVSRERLREQILADPDVETEAGSRPPAAPAPLDPKRELLISVLNDCEREFDEERHGDYTNAEIADWLLARGVRVSGANEETPQ